MQGLESDYGDKVEFTEVDISRDFATAEKYGVQATPTIVVIDRSGSVLDTLVGLPEESEVRGAIDTALR